MNPIVDRLNELTRLYRNLEARLLVLEEGDSSALEPIQPEHANGEEKPKKKRPSPASDELKVQAHDLYMQLRKHSPKTATTYGIAEIVKKTLGVPYHHGTVYNWLIEMGAPKDGGERMKNLHDILMDKNEAPS